MKKFFICASLFALVSLGASAQKIEAINKIVDCGQTTYQSPATAEFEVKNKSSHAVRIVDVRTSCGCTDVDYPKGDIAPDAKFIVRVTYDAQTMGRYDKFVDVYVSDQQRPVMLRMRGNVVREIVDLQASTTTTLPEYAPIATTLSLMMSIVVSVRRRRYTFSTPQVRLLNRLLCTCPTISQPRFRLRRFSLDIAA